MMIKFGENNMKKMIGVVMLACAVIANTMAGAMEEAKAYKKAINDPAAVHLARPSASQYAWQELERIMFVCLDPATWQGREYDNHTTDLKDMKLPKLDTDQWCEVAISWGAKEILFVAKHTGGFCWWQTETTDYSVKNIAWEDGKGDILKELSKSCQEFGLNLGVYVYPGDDQWGAGIGSGGRTSDPDKQEAYNKVLRQQWTEVLSNYGKVNEIWFDGSCVVPLGDIIKRYTPDAVVFQGPHATIRWPGTESGILSYPAWNSLTSKDLKTGTATAVHGNPDGDAWAPLEADTTLYDHHWFWAPEKEKKRKSFEHLIEIYYKSVGRGGVLLLNSTPNTDGLIPEGDMKHYQEFGDKIKRRFDHPLAEISGTGNEHTIGFEKPIQVNQAVIMEDYRYGERIRKYSLLGKTENGRWVRLNVGTSVGRKRIVVFRPHKISQLRLKINKFVGEPLIRSFKAYFVEDMDISNLIEEPPAISREKPAKASATHSAPYAADKINDGNLGTRWGADDPTRTCWIEIDLEKTETIDRVKIFELANRIRKFRVEYRNSPDENWKGCLEGTTVGDNYEKTFSPVSGRYFRLNILKATFASTIWEFRLFASENPGKVCHTIRPEQFIDGKAEVMLDLSDFFTKPGQYGIEIIPDDETTNLEVTDFKVFYNSKPVLEEMYGEIKKNKYYNINRTAQVTTESEVTLKMTFKTVDPSKAAGIIRIYSPGY